MILTIQSVRVIQEIGHRSQQQKHHSGYRKRRYDKSILCKSQFIAHKHDQHRREQEQIQNPRQDIQYCMLSLPIVQQRSLDGCIKSHENT